MGKGDRPRLSQVTSEETSLRWDYAKGKIDSVTFTRRYKVLLSKGLIRRNGRLIH